MEFEWDPYKASGNLAKHGVDFLEAATIFGDLFAKTFPDPDHSEGEDREVSLGYSQFGRLLFVAREALRLISAREATRGERSLYES